MFSSLLSKPLHSNYDSINNILVVEDKRNQLVISQEKRILPTNLNQSQFDKTIPLKKKYPSLIHNFPKIIDESVIESTRNVIENLMNDEPQKVEEIKGKNGKSYKLDPMLPPLKKLQKNRHVRLDEDQTPIIKPSTQISKEERMKWEIPAAISNWKNNQGFAIDLNKRMINQSSNDLKDEVNIKGFGELSQALQLADLQARNELKLKNEKREEESRNEKRIRDEKIKQIAKEENIKKIIKEIDS